MSDSYNTSIKLSDYDLTRLDSISRYLKTSKASAMKLSIHVFTRIVTHELHTQKIYYSVSGVEQELIRTRPISPANMDYILYLSPKLKSSTDELMKLTKLDLDDVIRNALAFTKDLLDARHTYGFDGLHAKSLDGKVTKLIFGV
jgi:hypothetical protein